MKLTPTSKPKGARIALSSMSQAQFRQELTALTVEFIEAGIDWAEVKDWEPLYPDAHSARNSMAYHLMGFPQVHVHRVGDKVYLRRRFEGG